MFDHRRLLCVRGRPAELRLTAFDASLDTTNWWTRDRARVVHGRCDAVVMPSLVPARRRPRRLRVHEPRAARLKVQEGEYVFASHRRIEINARCCRGFARQESLLR